MRPRDARRGVRGAALAVGMLRMTDSFLHWPVVRTRDEAVMARLPILVDVGGEYDPARHRYDHHQRGFDERFSSAHATKLSSAGLVYKHFGMDVIRRVAGDAASNEVLVQTVYRRMYDDFVECLDGIDNGIARYPASVRPAYGSGGTDLPARVGRLNPAWNESHADVDAQFEKAVAMATGEFVDQARHMLSVWWPARAIVERALDSRMDVDASGAIVVLDTACPWESHLFDLEDERGVQGAVLYVVFQDTNKTWRVRAMAASRGSFENRKPLPEPWRGLRDRELSAVLQLDGCIFVHASGFIGGHATRDGALQMARLAMSCAS